ncbi:hypothetical protein LR48_Vigan46s002500 [Vigna angularis]|uniref:Protein kinase domain-containing protein n=2 Tax=Phaseolus angularis TaxID=3914 RepID=A0A0L9T3B5_PHAAN|nr:receptor-like protein kinase FERONIA [Vigna angularis]KOM25063.1 hypothetical protein LR48_Vigan46s002500 [Vigna angularis]BAT74287.1 hypothetical protein VIGAN_01192200 [Vigna angularis var. angularis]
MRIPLIASLVAASLLLLSIVIGFIIFRCVRRVNSERDSNSESSSTRCREFSLAEIRAATSNFEERLIVGRGGFGNVYKGHIGTSHKPVAIKRLKPGSDQGVHEFQTEIKMLSRFRHEHLVSLIGYCNDGREMILVYDFMARGTLRDHLYGSGEALSWERRLKICLEAARGLDFLHAGVGRQSVIHRDVKSTNILLDENWVAKVSDFGLSKVGSNASHVTTDVKGSVGYLDPEYYMSLWLTHKSDVYSFGVILLEALCGRAPIVSRVEKDQECLVAWVKRCFDDGNVHETVDPVLKGSMRSKCLNKFVEIALSCLNDHGKDRPLMRDVVKGLEYALNLQCRLAQGEREIGLTEMERHGEFDEKFASSSSKATTTCSEEEQALVHVMFSDLGNQRPR